MKSILFGFTMATIFILLTAVCISFGRWDLSGLNPGTWIEPVRALIGIIAIALSVIFALAFYHDGCNSNNNDGCNDD